MPQWKDDSLQDYFEMEAQTIGGLYDKGLKWSHFQQSHWQCCACFNKDGWLGAENIKKKIENEYAYSFIKQTFHFSFQIHTFKKNVGLKSTDKSFV